MINEFHEEVGYENKLLKFSSVSIQLYGKETKKTNLI